jgi:ferrous iron transport protein B
MNVKMVIALNMYDELEASGNHLDYEKLSELIGVPIVPTIGRTGQGIDKLFHVIIESYEGSDFVTKNIRKQVRNEVMDDMEAWHKDVEPEEQYAKDHGIFRHIHVNHGPVLERSIEAVKKEIAHNEAIRHKYSTRFLSIKLLENDRDIERIVTSLPNGTDILTTRDREAASIMKAMSEDSEQAITDAKYGFISGALKETFTESQLEREQTTRVIDSIVTHRIWGYPIFFLFLYIMFEGTFVLGEYPMMGIEWIVEQIGNLVSHYMPEGPLKDLVIDGIIGKQGSLIQFFLK